MERESFESEEVAKIMNDNFVNIKVDREERPDIDKVYMTFVQVSTSIIILIYIASSLSPRILMIQRLGNHWRRRLASVSLAYSLLTPGIWRNLLSS